MEDEDFHGDKTIQNDYRPNLNVKKLQLDSFDRNIFFQKINRDSGEKLFGLVDFNVEENFVVKNSVRHAKLSKLERPFIIECNDKLIKVTHYVKMNLLTHCMIFCVIDSLIFHFHFLLGENGLRTLNAQIDYHSFTLYYFETKQQDENILSVKENEGESYHPEGCDEFSEINENIDWTDSLCGSLNLGCLQTKSQVLSKQSDEALEIDNECFRSVRDNSVPNIQTEGSSDDQVEEVLETSENQIDLCLLSALNLKRKRKFLVDHPWPVEFISIEVEMIFNVIVKPTLIFRFKIVKHDYKHFQPG